MNPLRKSEGIVEPALVNEMFYQIPEILKYHETFLKQLAIRVQDWGDNSKLADVFVSSVSCLFCFVLFELLLFLRTVNCQDIQDSITVIKSRITRLLHSGEAVHSETAKNP